MNLIKLEDVIVPPDRQRQDFKKQPIEELADSIHRLELLHAPVFEADGRTLRAGERRLRAIIHLYSTGRTFSYNGQPVPAGMVPFTTTREMSDAELYDLELSENLDREDLSWQERTVAVSRRFELYRQQAEAAGEPATVAGFHRRIYGPEVAATKNPTTQGTDVLMVAEHLADADVAAAKSFKEAKAIVKRKQTQLLEQELATRMSGADLVSQAVSPHTLHVGSAFDIAPTLPAGEFDIIITDPPYGIDADKMTTMSSSESGLRHTYTDDEGFAEQCTLLVANEGFRVTRPGAHCYMFCDLFFFPRWRAIFEAAGWYVWPNPIIWNKSPTGSLLGEANGPRHVYETVLYAVKGRKGVARVGNDVISIPGPSVDKLHPAEKPVALLQTFLSWSATPGDKIIDFFCGSGGIFPAATLYQCSATGVEKDPLHAATANNRRTSMAELL